MNLVVDIGNSRVKLALFNERDLLFQVPLEELHVSQLKLLTEEHPRLSRAIISAVREYPQEVRDFLHKHFHAFIEFGPQVAVPLKNRYKTPETLGPDRLAAAVGATVLFPGKNLLVIDAGTAVTYDLITRTEEYLGGNISPGLYTRFRALHAYTGRLPLVAPRNDFLPLGEDTESAIRAGVQQGLLFEAEQTIRCFSDRYAPLTVVLTGGDASFLEKHLNLLVFVRNNLALFGLNRILEYNC
ncbi:MAG: type III pantothenate kinase [Mangrovibacterium sp.]